MNNCSESFYEECKIASSDVESDGHDIVTVSVYSEPFSSPQKEKNIPKNLLEFDDVDVSYELKSGSNATRNLEAVGNCGDRNEIFFSHDKEFSVFESVRATVKKEVYHALELQNECEILNTMKEHMKEAVQFYELEYDQLVIVGCLNDLIFCQKYLASRLQRSKNSLKDAIYFKSKFEQPLQDTAEIEIYSDHHYEAEAVNFNKGGPENFSLANLNEEIKCSFELTFDEKYNQILRSYIKNPALQPASSNAQESLSNVLQSLSTTTQKQEFYQFSCNICSFKCSRRNHLLKHKSQHQKNTKLYYCDLCDFKTIRLSQLGKHKKIHNQENIAFQVENNVQKNLGTEFNLECSISERSLKVDKLKKKSKLQGKKNTQAKIVKENKFFCKICDFIGKQKKDYRAHLESAHPIKYCCNQCEYSTYKKVHYVRHMKCVHENERPYVCSLCPMAFKRCDALTQHQVIHVKEAKKLDRNAKVLFKCHICKKVVRSAAYLKEHWLTHSEDRSFLCEICGSAFKTRAVHRNHLKVVHGDEEKPFCQTCGKSFATKFSLSRHMSQHGIRSHGMWSNIFMVSPEMLSSETTERSGS